MSIIDQLNNPGIIFLSMIVVFMIIAHRTLKAMPDAKEQKQSIDKDLENRKKLNNC